MPHVAVSIVSWNSMKHLPDAIESVVLQTFKDLSVIVVDNASSDGAVEFVRSTYPQAMVLRNSKNLGIARAHNQAIAHAAAHLRRDGDLFVLTMSPDVVLEPDFVSTLVGQVERRPEIGSAGGKTYRMRTGNDDGPAGGERTMEIDSAGMQIVRSRRVSERGAGMQDDGGRFARTEEVFGFSGGLVLYRMQALESVAYKGEVFDEDFFANSEDVDVAWRLRLAGWQSAYVPSAKAYRYRAAPAVMSFLSYRNHFLLRMKNDRLMDALLALPWIAWHDFRTFLSVLVFAPRSLRAFPSMFWLLPRMLAKRSAAMRIDRTPAKEMRQWFR